MLLAFGVHVIGLGIAWIDKHAALITLILIGVFSLVYALHKELFL